MIRPPSNIRQYDDFYSGDSAIVQIEADADEAAKTERARLITVARETGNWQPILVEGGNPTKFTMTLIKGDAYRRLIDMVTEDKIGVGQMSAMAFRASIDSISNLGGFQVKRGNRELGGNSAAVEVTDYLDSIDIRIVSELGGEALRRAREISPKH